MGRVGGLDTQKRITEIRKIDCMTQVNYCSNGRSGILFLWMKDEG